MIFLDEEARVIDQKLPDLATPKGEDQPASVPAVEIFNSDAYDLGAPFGNGGQAFAEPFPLHGFGFSAALTLPANGLLLFAR